MVHHVRKSLIKPLVYLLVAAQLLLAVPAIAVAPVDSVACDHTAMASGGDECPCCPDGAHSMSSCLVSCSVGAASMPTHQFAARVLAPSVRVASAPVAPFNSLSDPPLKPPPIA
jgi:hypothetical protein